VSLPIVFRRAARAEFDDAADWYEQRRTGLGPAFTATVQRVLDRIAAQPDLFATVWADVREAPVGRFPYAVYYREEPSQLLVLSIFHTSRDPSIWKGRA
jgi:plasmid stabilization system protein ParE